METRNEFKDISQSALTKVIEALKKNDNQAVANIISDLEPAEVARTLESLPPVERDLIWDAVDQAEQGEILAHLDGDVLDDIIEDMTTEELSYAVEDLDDDDLVDIIGDIPKDKAFGLLQTLDAENREKIIELLEYDEDTAGGLMSTKTITVRADTTVEATIRYLRMRDETPNVVTKLFVTDRESYLQGELHMAHLVVADRESAILDIMEKSKPIQVEVESNKISQIFREHDLVSAAVVNKQGQLLGQITVDDVIDVMQREAERTFLNTAGLDEEEDTFAPIDQAIVSRGLWLGINLLTALLAASVINVFGATIEKVVALAALSPLVASMGGIAGSQSLTIIIRGIALGQIEGANAKLLLRRELTIGVINGLFWGAVTAIISLIWFNQMNLAFIVMFAIFVNLCFAALSGVLIPLLLKKMDIDPALAGSVILTTVTDVVGFIALLGLAAIFL